MSKCELDSFSYYLCRQDEFVLEVPHLGQLHQINIGHDNSGLAPAWYLDKVTVEDMKEGIVYVFMCNSWLAKGKGDGAIVKLLDVEEPADVSKSELCFIYLYFE